MTSKSDNRYSPELRERDSNGGDGGLSTSERQRLKELERENRELRRSNDILRQTSRIFCEGGVRPPLEKVMPLLDSLRSEHGVGPVCHELNIAPSTYYRYREHQLHPTNAVSVNSVMTS